MAYASAHNGGRSQLNVSPPNYYGSFPFINHAKTISQWDSAVGMVDPDILDVNGFPTVNVSGGIRGLIFIERQVDRPGNYVFKWDGDGTISHPFDSDLGTITGSPSSSGGSLNNRMTGIPYTNKFLIGYSSTSSSPNHIRNLRFCHIDDEAAMDAGAIFNPRFLSVIRELNPGVIRFLDWQNGNTNNMPTWASKRSTSCYSYTAGEFRGAVWGANRWYFGATTNVGNAYSISTSRGRAPLHNDIIQLYFNADATKSGLCSLNVDGSGAVNILSEYGTALSTGGNSYPLRYAYTDVAQKNYATLVYDAIIPAWVKQGGDDAAPASGLNSYVPFEMMIELCAQVGAHPWFVTPYHCMDPLSDLMPSLASYVKTNYQDTVTPWMIPYFEGPNECFNTFGGFYNGNNMMAHQGAMGDGFPAGDYMDLCGKYISVFGQNLSTLYGGDRTKYELLIGVQTSTGRSSASSSNKLFNSPAYVAQSAAPQSPYIKSAAKNWATGVACANYFGPSNQDQADEGVMAAAYAAGDLTRPAAYVALCYGPASSSPAFNIARNLADFTGFKNLVVPLGIMKMRFYEGGFSPDYDGDAERNALKNAAKHDSSLYQVLLDDYAVCTSLSGGGFDASFPSHYYLSADPYNQNNGSVSVWALLEPISETPRPPQARAISDYNVVSGGGGGGGGPTVHFRHRRV